MIMRERKRKHIVNKVRCSANTDAGYICNHDYYRKTKIPLTRLKSELLKVETDKVESRTMVYLPVRRLIKIQLLS